MIPLITFSVDLPVRAVAEVGRRARTFEEDARDLMDQYGIWTMEMTSELSPWDTGFMSSRVTYTPEGNEGLAWTVGWHRKDFDAAELPFYPPYLEFGTVFSPAQPSLGPAGREMFPLLQQDAVALSHKHFGR